MHRRIGFFSWFRLFMILFAVAVHWSAIIVPCDAQAASEALTQTARHTILFLRSYGYGREGPESYNAKFFSVLNECGMSADDVMLEYLDLNRNRDAEYRIKKRELLLHQYLGKPIDLIVAVEQPALVFLLEELRQLAPGAPVMAINATVPTGQLAAGHRFLQKTVNLDFKGTLDRAIELFPQTRRVVVVTGTAEQDLAVKAESQETARLWKDRLEFEYTDHLTMDEILKRVAGLPPHTIVAYRAINRDKTGKIFIPFDVLLSITKVANAPVFGLYNNYIGATGVIGGSVYHITKEAEFAAHIALAIMNGDMQLTEPVKSLPSKGTPMFDWEQINRWGGDPSRLPLDSIFVNRPPALWQQYRSTVITTASVFLVMIVLIGILLTGNRRRRIAEISAIESERRYKTIIQTAMDGIWFVDLQGRLLHVNDAYCRMSGYTEDELLTMSISDLEAVKTSDEIASGIRKIVAKGYARFESRHHRKDGSVYDIDISVQYLPDTGDRIVFFMRDITESKRMEDTLRDSEERYRMIFNHSPLGVMHFDSNGIITDFNDKFAEIMGAPRENILGFDMLQRLRDQAMIKAVKEALDGKLGYYEGDYVSVTGGKTTPMRAIYQRILGDDDKFLGAVGLFEDITERRNAEAALIASRDLFCSVVENAPVRVFWKDVKLRYLGCNSAFARDAGMSRPEDVIGKDDFQMVWREQAEIYRTDDRRVMDSNAAKLNYEEPQTTPDGRTIWLRTSKVPLLDSQGSVFGILGIYEDITERKRDEEEHQKLQDQYNQAQKMESVGRLAGGVAHDFNNMLSIVLGHAEMVLDVITPEDPLHHSIMEIKNAAERSADLTRQLLAFARKQTINPKILDLNETASGILKMLRRLIGENINIAWVPGLDIWPVKMDPSQIDQILANLSVNARDAIAGAGVITIETANVTLDQNCFKSYEEITPGDYVMLAVSDTGAGMDRKTLDRIFEPFFTTKELGKGTGLGLATVYGIVKQNNGLINVYSEPGQGATFRIYLPRAQEPATDGASGSKREKDLRGTETVLLVEDEASVLTLGKAILERYGYSVLTAYRPDEALRIAENHPGPIHLLITDVVMPGMNGKDLKDRFNALKPGFKCMFMSGYTADAIAHHGVLDEGIHFLQKPFSVRTLSEKVREVLDRG